MTTVRYFTRAKLQEIREASQTGDWFTALVLSATELERFGSERIRDYLCQRKKVERKLAEALIKPLFLHHVADCLLAMGVISKKERSAIMAVNDLRNDYIHREQRRAKFLYRKEAREKYAPLVKEAIRILKEKLEVVKGFVVDEEDEEEY